MKKNIMLILNIISINLFAQKNQNSFNLELFNEPTTNSIEFFNKQHAEKALNAKNKNLNANKTNVLFIGRRAGLQFETSFEDHPRSRTSHTPDF